MNHGPTRAGSEDVVTRQGNCRVRRRLALGGVSAALIAIGLAGLMTTGSLVAGRSSDSQLSTLSKDAHTTQTLAAAYGRLPLSFETNRGQVRGAGSERVKFLARGRGYTLFLAPDEAVLSIRSQQSGVRSQEAGAGVPNPDSQTPEVVRLKLLGANRQAPVEGREELAGKSNYFVGRDPAGWRTGVPNFRRVKVEDVYPGIDLVYYGRERELEYDWVVAPGAGAGRIELEVETANSPAAERGRQKQAVRLAANGDLVIMAGAGEVRLRRPVVYQEESGVRIQDSATRAGARHPSPVARHFVKGRYVLTAGNRVRLEISDYDRSRPLIIDPVLSYSTYLGGSGGDSAYGIAVDANGNAYVTGTTSSTDFPTQNPLQDTGAGNADVFVAKLNAAGTALVYSTYLGGSSLDRANALALDGSGNAYITGFTQSTNFPTSTNAFQDTTGGNGDAFVAKLSADGMTLAYSTYLGGGGADFGQGIAVDSTGNAYVTGSTQSADFPTANPLQSSNHGGSDAFVSKLKPDGTGLVYSTYLGGGGTDLGLAVAVDGSNNAYVAGHTASTNFPVTAGAVQTSAGGSGDAFVAKLNAAGSATVYSTYLGGSGFDRGDAIAVDASGAAYVTGLTNSTNFPTASAFQTASGGNGDAFVAKLNSGGSALSYSTYLGGVDAEEGFGIAVDGSGTASVTGFTRSDNFPVANAIQAGFGGGTCSSGPCADAFVTRLDATGTVLAYSTYLGGMGGDFGQAIAVDGSGNAYVTGSTASNDFPTLLKVFQDASNGGPLPGDAFVSKIALTSAPAAVFSPSQLTFAQIPSGTSSSVQTVTLRNYSSGPMTISNITASGDFSQTNNCGGSLAAGGASCTISVTFSPTTTGTFDESLTVTDDAAGSPQSISLAGTAGAPAPLVSLTPATLSFADQTVGSPSAAKDATLTNTGSADLTITSILTSQTDFTQTNNCPGTLSPGANCAIHVTFSPTQSGGVSDTLNVVDSATGSPHKVALSGTGLAVFSLASDPATITLDREASSQTFTISASAPSTFTGSIQLTCDAVLPTTCSFNPTVVTPGQTSTMTLSGFSGEANSFTIGITGTSGNQSTGVGVAVKLTNFSLAVSPPLRTIAAGDPTTFTVSLLPVNGFKKQVSVNCGFFLSSTSAAACALGSIQATSCSASPGSLTSDGTSTPTTTVTVTTTAPSQLVPPPPGKSPHLPYVIFVFLLATTGMAVVIRRRSPGYTLPLAMALLLLALSTSCDTTYTPLFQGTVVGTGTPGGLYSVGIVGTEGTLTRCTAANLGVH